MQSMSEYIFKYASQNISEMSLHYHIRGGVSTRPIAVFYGVKGRRVGDNLGELSTQEYYLRHGYLLKKITAEMD